MTAPKTIRTSSTKIRTAFGQWLAVEHRARAELVVLEGLTLSGKTTLTKQPFILDDAPSKNIEMDDFLSASVNDATSYLDAIDRSSMLEELEKALREPALVILQGAIVWPAVETAVTKLDFKGVRRVYLKRMANSIPDYWEDEEWILDPALWSPTGLHRSIYKYHADERPWLKCDLIIERIAEKPALGM
jgi:chloramphenicol 3-O-phosphotransferase